MSTPSNDMRRFRTRAEMNHSVDDFIRERTDPMCDVPGCQRRWVNVRKLGWSTGAEVFAVAYFACHKHLRMPYAKFLKAAPTGIPAFDNAPSVADVAPNN